MKRILCSLLIAALPFGSVFADAPKSRNAKETLVYQHELPNVPGKSIKGVLVEYGPGGYSPAHTHAKSLSSTRPSLRGDPQSGQRRTTDDLQGRTKLLRASRRPPRRQRQCQQDAAGQAPRGVRGGHERDGADDPIRELSFGFSCQVTQWTRLRSSLSAERRGDSAIHETDRGKGYLLRCA